VQHDSCNLFYCCYHAEISLLESGSPRRSHVTVRSERTGEEAFRQMALTLGTRRVSHPGKYYGLSAPEI
ncbi:hypothetical protein ACR3TG_004762, partial [Salmonella enterica]